MTALAMRENATATEEKRETVTKSRTTTRVQLELQLRAMERLQAMKEKTEAVSYAEVVKNALRLYEALIEEVEKGNEFLMREKDGNTYPYKMFL